MKHIIQALNSVMTDVSYVQKSSKNDFHGYKYASEAALLESLRPAMIKHGLVLIPSVNNVSPIDQFGNTTLTVEYTLAHTSGEIWPDKITAVGCGNDRAKSGAVGDKGIYKAITGANKYLLFKLFQIETGDDPEKDDAAQVAPTPEVKALPAAPKATAPVPPKATTPKAGSGPQSIVLPEKSNATGEDVDKYVAVFIESLVFSSSEKEVREFWKQEAKNRGILSIEPNNDEYKKMTDACANRIAVLKDNKNG